MPVRCNLSNFVAFLICFYDLFSEYYFSEENLVKDLFLRRKMDADGFLPVTLIASFYRVRSLTNDVSLVICAIKQSEHLELVDGFKVIYRSLAHSVDCTKSLATYWVLYSFQSL